MKERIDKGISRKSITDGVSNRTGMTMEEIAECLGLTRSMVQVILRSALEKMKIECSMRGLSLGDLLECKVITDKYSTATGSTSGNSF